MRHGQRDVASLPRRLAAIGDEEVARRRAAALELFDRVDYASGAAVDMLLDRFAALVAPGTRSRPGPDVSVELVATGPLRLRKGTQDAARAKQCLPAGLVAGALGVDASRIAGSERALRVLLDKAGVLAATAPRGDCDRPFLAAAAAALRMAHPDEVGDTPFPARYQNHVNTKTLNTGRQMRAPGRRSPRPGSATAAPSSSRGASPAARWR